MLNSITDKQKINYVRVLAILPVLVMMIYAPKLWLSTKIFPTLPLFDWIPTFIYPVDIYLFASFFLAIFIYIFYNKRWLGWLCVVLFVFFGIADQNRLQPYFYQSALTLFAIVLFPEKSDTKKVLYTVILIFLATYFWSGIQKVNDAFYIQWLGALNKHFSFLPQWFLKYFTYAVPWLEGVMGVLLLFNKTRKFGVAFILFMHFIIVAILIYLGYGYNVIPWNIQNILSTYILFWTLKTSNAFEFFTNQFDYRRFALIFITFCLPVANNLFGVYDKLLSFHFFTADLSYYNVYVSDNLKDKLPKHVQQFYRTDEKGLYIQINEWSQKDNKVLFHPEKRSILYIDAYLRSFADNPNQEGLTKLFDYNKVVE